MLAATPDQATQATGGQRQAPGDGNPRWHWQPLADPSLNLVTPPRIDTHETLLNPASELFTAIRPARETLIEALQAASALGAVSDEAIQALAKATMQEQAPELIAWRLANNALGGWLDGSALVQHPPAIGAVDEQQRRCIASRVIELETRQYLPRDKALELGGHLMRPAQTLNDDAQALEVRDQVADLLEGYAQTVQVDTARIRITAPREGEPVMALEAVPINHQFLSGESGQGYAHIEPTELALCEIPGDEMIADPATLEALKQGLGLIDRYLRSFLIVGELVDQFEMFFDEMDMALDEIEQALGVDDLLQADPEAIDAAIDQCDQVDVGGLIESGDEAIALKNERQDRQDVEHIWSLPEAIDTLEAFTQRINALAEPQNDGQRHIQRWLANVADTLASEIDASQSLLDLSPCPEWLMGGSIVVTPDPQQCPKAQCVQRLIDEYGESVQQGEAMAEPVPWSTSLTDLETLTQRSQIGSALLTDLCRIANGTAEDEENALDV